MLLFLFLTILSILALLIGGAWVLIRDGKTRRRSGPEVGAEIMAGQMEDDEDLILGQKTFFKGKAVAVERQASFGFSDIKRLLRAGRRGEALPMLLAMGGFAGVFFFGGLTALFTLGLPLGGLIFVVAAYVLVRMALDLIRA